LRQIEIAGHLTPLLQRRLCMSVRNETRVGSVDGSEDRDVPSGGRDDQPPTRFQEADDELKDLDDRDFDPGWDDGDPADRRRDPLRRP